MTFPIPKTALQQHIAVLGKTGSGKSSTARLMIEHVVEQGARVCVLDPIKSDWWGITSSSSGKAPGLSFTILGGPHGHVPINADSGAIAAELVATGQLPLSIIDMAEFGPGGTARFFKDFAPKLMSKMKGVLYLVMEEAHEFAPKERSGAADENMAIYYAKKLATAGRSKGIRLVVLTQRTQSLHNAVLGSCDTMITHRLTAPADQAPVIAWLKANVSKEVFNEITSSMSSLKTGEGWICSGEAQKFERVAFPRFKTFDNTKTPEAGDRIVEVVNALESSHIAKLMEQLKVEQDANDPKQLHARIRELERQLRDTPKDVQYTVADIENAKSQGYKSGFNAGKNATESHYIRTLRLKMRNAVDLACDELEREPVDAKPDDDPFRGSYTPPPTPKPTPVLDGLKKTFAEIDARRSNGDASISPSARKILDTIHRAYPLSLSFDAAARRANISKRSSAYRKYRQEVLTSDEIELLSDNRLKSLPQYASKAPPTSGNPIDNWAAQLPPTYASMLRAVAEHGPLDKNEIAGYAQVSPTSSGLGSGLRELMSLDLIEKTSRGDYVLSEGL